MVYEGTAHNEPVYASPLKRLDISRETPITQEVDLRNGSRLRAETIEDIADKITLVSQDMKEQMLSPDRERVLREEFAAVVGAERGQREAADNVLQENIDDEILARGNADNILQENIDEEARTRALEDTAIRAEILDETEGRQAGRQAGDAALEDKKLDKKPDAANPLIDGTGKINTRYIPDFILGAVAGMVDLGSADTPTFELEQKIGDLSTLDTTDKSSLTAAVNEVNGKV